MNAFNRLPGFVQTPAGRERDVLRLLHRVLVFGTLLLALPSLGARIFLGKGMPWWLLLSSRWSTFWRSVSWSCTGRQC